MNNKLLLIIGIAFIFVVSGCGITYDEFGIVTLKEQEEVETKVEITITILDRLQDLGFETECVENKTVERIKIMKVYNFCIDSVCEISSKCKRFMEEHNVNTINRPFIIPHKRNKLIITTDFCDFNTEYDFDKCLDECNKNYYDDELINYWNETICKKEILVRRPK